MALTPREVYLGAMGGGAATGLILCGWGLLNLLASFGNTTTQWQFAVEGATFFAVGAAFVLVSLVVLPAVQAIHLDSGLPPS